MGPMQNLEHPGAVMREWWLEGADPISANLIAEPLSCIVWA